MVVWEADHHAAVGHGLGAVKIQTAIGDMFAQHHQRFALLPFAGIRRREMNGEWEGVARFAPPLAGRSVLGCVDEQGFSECELLARHVDVERRSCIVHWESYWRDSLP